MLKIRVPVEHIGDEVAEVNFRGQIVLGHKLLEPGAGLLCLHSPAPVVVGVPGLDFTPWGKGVKAAHACAPATVVEVAELHSVGSFSY